MVASTASTQDDLRRLNRARVLRRLHQSGAATRSELVAYTGLNRSTIGAVVTELADSGLVVEHAGQPGQVGRPSLRVMPHAESAVAIALDMRVGRTVAALVGLGGTVLARMEQPHPRDYAPETAVSHLVQLIADLRSAGPRDAAWVGVGVGVPGTVDHPSGAVRYAPNLGWSGVPFADLLRSGLVERFGRAPDIWVGNDADLGAVAEHVRGRGMDCRNLIYVTADVGIGGGVIVDGRALIGAGGLGGEVGHMVIDPRGATCRCGARGCWETFIGRDAIISAAGRAEVDLEVVDILTSATSGGAREQAALQATGESLGIGLSNLVNILDPEVIVLGGHLRHLYAYVSTTVEATVQRALPATRSRVAVVVTELDDDSTLLGAAEMAFEGLLADPVEVVDRYRGDVAS